MTKLDLQYDLVNYTPASASPVEANLDRIEQHVNQETIERDGTVAMRAQLKLVGDPVNELDAAPKQYVDQVLPVGIIMMYGGASTPPGGRWALCNGAEMETALQPELFAVIGTNFSPPGTPAGRFHLPQLGDRMPLGVGGTTTLGATGGTKDAIVPTHSHLMDHGHPGTTTGDDSPDHIHHTENNTDNASQSHYHAGWDYGLNIVMYDPGAPNGSLRVWDGGSAFGIRVGGTNYESHVHNHWFTSNSGGANVRHRHSSSTPSTSGQRTAVEGVAVANTNLPPYLGVQYIIRIK